MRLTVECSARATQTSVWYDCTMSDTTSSQLPAAPEPASAGNGGTVTLKVLTGSQLGIEVHLPEGQFTFGSDDAADVRFLDVAMAPLHGQIRIGGGKIQVQATGGAITAASGLAIEPGGDSWHEVAQLDRIRAGTTQFALGDRSARWADVLDGSEGRDGPSPRRAAAAGARRGLVFPAIAILAVLAVAGLVWQGSTTAGLAVPEADSASTAAALRNVIDAFPFAPVLTLEVEADGRNIISGYVESADERRAVEAAIAEIDPQARRRIWVREAMRSDVEGMIETRELDVAATVADNGIVRLEGRVLEPETAAALVSMIEDEVFGVAGIDDRIETAEDILAAVDAVLLQAGLSDVVIARLDGLLIETTGVIPNARAERWIGFVQTYATRYADILPLRSFVTLESAPAGGVAEPLVVGDAARLDGLEGRRLPTDRFRPDQDLRVEDVFGEGVSVEGAGGDTGELGPESPAPEVSRPQSSPVATAMVLDFAARNPELVDTIIREVTGGRFTGLDELRQTPAPSVAQADPATVQPTLRADAAPLFSVPTPTLAVSALGSSASEQGVARRDPDTLPEPEMGGGTSPTVAADGAFLRYPTLRRADAGIVGATAALLGAPLPADLMLPGLADMRPSVERVPPDLLRLVREQQVALEQGGSLLPPAAPRPEPLSAQPADPAAAQRVGCWPGAYVDPADIPAALLWLDMLSLGEDGGFGQLDADLQLQVFDVALSPGRLLRCMGSERVEFGQQLMQASAFLNEIFRNDAFIDYVFRDVPRTALPVSGVDLSGQRRIALEGQRVLREGGAPDAASRVVVIGELGALVRVRDGFRLSIYPSDLDWRIEERAP